MIIIYREGLSESQVQVQLPNEVEALNDAVKEINSEFKFNRVPSIVYMTVNKKIDSRFFTTNRGQFANPDSGSIIVESLGSQKANDFYLVPQAVTQGVATPSHFIIAYENYSSGNAPEVPNEAITQFTFEECFNYFNWQGAVRVPACLQYANKLSNFIGEHLGEKLNTKELENCAFFI